MRKQVCWLHISDIHFRAKSKLDHTDAFKRIRSDLGERRAQGLGPDFIFVTGDIAHAGRAAEFDEISDRLIQLCEDSNLARERVFFCPGNHDSDRRLAPILLRGCWSACHSMADFQAFLATAEYTALTERQAAYRAFVRGFRGDDAGFDRHELHAFAEISLDDLRVGVLSVNSALLAEGGPMDKGRLQVCARILEDYRAGPRIHQLAFTLIHHPFEWLAPFEADRAETLVLESADVVLRGHLHQPRLVGSVSGGIVSAAGAVWEASAGDYEYSIGSLTFDTLTCQIQTVRFVQQSDRWMSSYARATLPRDRDHNCTPGAIRAELGEALMFPAQVAGVLSGYTSELVITVSGSPNYSSTERILIESIGSEGRDLPALGVIRAGNLLTFYGSQHLRAVLGSQAASLAAYDRMLQDACATDPDFAALVNAREADAEKLMRRVPSSARSWSIALMARLVAEGDVIRLAVITEHDDTPFVARLKASLAGGARDPFEAWQAAGGPELAYDELAAIATRLAVKGTADLARLALSEAARRFPIEARRLDSVAKIVASELSASEVYAEFQQTVRRA